MPARRRFTLYGLEFELQLRDIAIYIKYLSMPISMRWQAPLSGIGDSDLDHQKKHPRRTLHAPSPRAISSLSLPPPSMTCHLKTATRLDRLVLGMPKTCTEERPISLKSPRPLPSDSLSDARSQDGRCEATREGGRRGGVG